MLRAALELYAARHYAVVAAVCADALVDEREGLHLRLLRAQALVALRRDAEAEVELRGCLERAPRCAPAYRLLGEVAARRDELATARRFLRAAVRLAPDDGDARAWLAVVQGLVASGRAVVRDPR